MAIKYDERNKSYSRLNDSGKNLGTVMPGDSLGRYGSIAAEYKQQQSDFAKAKEPSGYDKYKAAAEQYNNALKAAKDEQTEAAVRNMTNQIKEYKASTEAANAEAYAAKRISEKNMGQQLAAAGINNTGAGETARLQNELNWQNTVNQNNRQQLSAEENIKNQIAQYRANAATEKAQLDANLGQELNQMYWEQEQNAAAQRLQQEQFEYQKQRDLISDQQQAQALAASNRESEQGLALQLLNLGYNSEQIASLLGLSTAQIARTQAAKSARSQKSSSSASGASSASSAGNTGNTDSASKLSQSTALKLLELGYDYDEVQRALYMPQDSGSAGTAAVQSGAVADLEYANQGQVDDAYIDGKISEAEWRQIYNRRGWEIE